MSKEEYLILRELSHTAKNLYNQAVYNIRQHYFDEEKYLSNELENLKEFKKGLMQQMFV